MCNANASPLKTYERARYDVDDVGRQNPDEWAVLVGKNIICSASIPQSSFMEDDELEHLEEKEFLDRKMFEIEKKLARVSGYNRHGEPMYDHHIIEYDTRLFWSLDTFKKSGVYHARVTIEFPEKEVLLIKAMSLETLMDKVDQRMLKYEDDFKEWIIFMST